MPLIIGHRGAAGLAPENTLASIEKALSLGVDRIEIDIHQTKDNVLVVIHDETLERTTNGKGKIKDLTYREILKYSAGAKFSPACENEKVPTLAEVLDLIDGKSQLLIELKKATAITPELLKTP
jgi:glycerophosphoryl diester phosphodiesterase